MMSLPDDVRLSIAADQARAQQAELAEADRAGAAETPPADADAAPMTTEEMMRKARMLASAKRQEPKREAAAAASPTGDEAVAATEDPQAIFQKALEMSRLDNPTAADRQQDASQEEAPEAAMELAYAAEPVATPVETPAETAAATLKGDLEADPVGFADSIRTSAFAAGADDRKGGADVFAFTMDLDKGGLTPEVVTQLRLRFIGGRVARRVVVGRLEGDIRDVLQEARRRGEDVAAVVGPDAGLSYDPAMAAGSVRVEYEPRS